MAAPTSVEIDRLVDALIESSGDSVKQAWAAANTALDRWEEAPTTSRRIWYFTAFNRFESAARQDRVLRAQLGVW